MVKLKIFGVIICLIIIVSPLLYAQPLPDYFDWRENNGDWMTYVKSQGNCDSCWAFSALGVVEAQYNIANNNPNLNLNLAEQELVSDCSSAGSCCGGVTDQALQYVRDTGVVNQSCFPYADSNCNCKFGCACTYSGENICSNAQCSDKNCIGNEYRIDSYEAISSNINSIKNYLFETGPISAIIRYANFTIDDEGIYSCLPDALDNRYNHAIIITGYSDTGDVSTSYWVVKNSWGPDWPEENPDADGYLKVGFGECSIEDYIFGVSVTGREVSGSETLTISNTGNAVLEVENIHADVDWVSEISDINFTISEGSSKNVTITVNNFGIGPGIHNGNIIISSDDPDPDEAELIIPITLIYKQPSTPDSSVLGYTFVGAGVKNNYIRIPKNATIINASLWVKEVY